MTDVDGAASDNEFADGDGLISAIACETDIETLSARLKARKPVPMPENPVQRRRYADSARELASTLADIRMPLAMYVYSERKMQDSLLIQDRPPFVKIEVELRDAMVRFKDIWQSAPDGVFELLTVDENQTILNGIRRIATAVASSMTLYANTPVARHHLSGAIAAQLRDPKNKTERQMAVAFAAEFQRNGWSGFKRLKERFPTWVFSRQLEADMRRTGRLHSRPDDSLDERRRTFSAAIQSLWRCAVEPLMYRIDNTEAAAQAARGIGEIEDVLAKLSRNLKDAESGNGPALKSSVSRASTRVESSQHERTCSNTPDDSHSPWYACDPAPDSKYKHGPVTGTLTELTAWIDSPSQPTLRNQNGKSYWYIRRLMGRRYSVWFDNHRTFAEVNQRFLISQGAETKRTETN